MTTQPLNLVIFGATGGTGRQLLDQALAAGHRVTAFVRNPTRLALHHDLLTVAVGDVLDPQAVAAAVVGQDVVLSALGAPVFDSSGLRARGTANIIAAMEAAGIDRFVSLSTHGIGESRASLPFVLRYLVVPLYLARAFADHEVQEQYIRASDLAWTIVKPPHLTDGPRTDEIREDVAPDDRSMAMKISRADVAAFMLRQVHDRRYVQQGPVISY